MGNSNSEGGTKYVIGIDLGTSGPKVALVEDSGKVVAIERGHTDTYFLEGGGAEQDANQWWSEIKQAMKAVLAAARVPKEQIVGIGTCATYSDTLPVDEHGEPLANSLIWMDSRGAEYNANIMKGFPSVQGYGLTKMLKMLKKVGVPPLLSGIDSVGHMGYFKTRQPDIYKKTHKFLEPMDYITFKLTGKLTTTQGNSFASMVVDNRTWGSIEYDKELLKIIGIDKDKFPDLLPNDGIVGTVSTSVAEEFGLDPSTQVVAGSTDNYASALGAGVANDLDGAIVIGTSHYMTGLVPFKKSDLKHLILTMPAPPKGRYIVMGVQGSGGKNIEMFLERLIFNDDQFGTGEFPDNAYEIFDEMAAEAPAGANGTMFLPWVTGTIVPSESPFSRAAIFNLGMETHRSDICRAVTEGLALQHLWTKGPMEQFFGQKFKSFRLSGGGSRSKTLGQAMADALGVPVHAADDPLSVSARGTGLNAFLVLGHCRREDIPNLVPIKQSYEPNKANRAVYDKLLTQFKELHAKTKPIYTALNAN